MNGVLLAGDLGARDPGDDALLAAFARELPRWPLVLMSADPARVRHRHGRPTVSTRDPRRMLGAVRHCEMLLLGDGALRGPARGERTRDVLAITLAAKALGRRVALLGVGVGGLHRRSDRRRVGALVRLSDLLVLRDPSAADALLAAGAPGPFRVAADPAWCALETAVSTPSERRDEVLVILDSRAVSISGSGPARLAAALDRLAARGLRVRLAPWRISRYGADDLDLARAIAARLGARARILLPPASLSEARSEAAGARVVLALRLHALIVAASAGTPAVALGDELEMGGLAGRLGLPSLPLAADPAAVAWTAMATADGAPATSEAVNAERSTAREAFRLLRLLLDAGRSDEDHDVAALPLVPEPMTRPLTGSVTPPTELETEPGTDRATRRARQPRRRQTAGSARR
jgi:polysaccharide pyruvyl transferase WcaK-like protein